MAFKSWRYEVSPENRSKKILAFMFLRFCEDFSYKSSSMKSVRAAAIMFVSFDRHHALSKTFKQMCTAITLLDKFEVCLSECTSYTWTCLKCFKTSARNSVVHKKAVLDLVLRSAPHSRRFAQMCTTICFEFRVL